MQTYQPSTPLWSWPQVVKVPNQQSTQFPGLRQAAVTAPNQPAGAHYSDRGNKRHIARSLDRLSNLIVGNCNRSHPVQVAHSPQRQKGEIIMYVYEGGTQVQTCRIVPFSRSIASVLKVEFSNISDSVFTIWVRQLDSLHVRFGEGKNETTANVISGRPPSSPKIVQNYSRILTWPTSSLRTCA